jgi:acyl carrier protein phosphodiesterase
MAAEKCIAVMNYLAHAYLSFGNTDILLGNMMSDFVKGKRKFYYDAAIQKGIMLHRSIDSFTDAHQITRKAKQYFKPAVGLYAGAFVDVVYDHFLAINDAHWQQQSLRSFSNTVYNTLTERIDTLPENFQQMLPYMKTYDWLYNYQFRWGIEKSFEGVTRRAVYLNNSVAAFNAFNEHYIALEQLSRPFLNDVKNFASNEFDLLIKV